MENIQKVVIQGLMTRGCVSAEELIGLYEAGCSKFSVEPNKEDELEVCKNLIMDINLKLNPLCMKVQAGVDDLTGIKHYVLVKTLDDEISKLSRAYSNKELDYFKRLLQEIVLSEEAMISTVGALNLARSTSLLSASDAELFLRKLQEHNWLTEKSGFIGLSVRAMVDLESYIKAMMGDSVYVCPLCSALVLKGVACEMCETKLHAHCLFKFLPSCTQPMCPTCYYKFRKTTAR